MRRPNDFYPTPEGATQKLLDRIQFDPKMMTSLEPCAGTGQISRLLGPHCLTADIDPAMGAMMTADMTSIDHWPKVDWVITNPPFEHARQFVENALISARSGVAMLLRLSFLEPTRDRRTLLTTQPPNRLYILPRISFTGDGKTDSITCAWMVWDLDPRYLIPSEIEIIPPDAN